MDEVVWRMQENLIRDGSLTPDATQGSMVLGSREFKWKAQVASAVGDNQYRLGLEVLWKAGTRNASAERATSLLHMAKPEMP